MRAEALERVDVLFLCLPHGSAMARIDQFAATGRSHRRSQRRLPAAPRATTTCRWYGEAAHQPGVARALRLRAAGAASRARSPARTYVSGVGCNATATTLASGRWRVAGLIDAARGIVCEVKVGSSEGGAASSDASHHPERAGVMRSFAPTGHRHTAEVLQALRLRGFETDVHLSATAVDNVRGVLATAHAFVKPGVGESDLWKAYRDAYSTRAVRPASSRSARASIAIPEPKILSGSNYADVGFELDASTRPRRRDVRDRQPDERRRRHGGAVREPDDGMGRDAGPRVPGCTRCELPSARISDRNLRSTQRLSR